MKYGDALLKFWNINKQENLGSSAAGFYSYLVHRWFDNKCEGFSISDAELRKELSLSLNTIRIIRQKLEAFKLIQYEAKIGAAGSYNLPNENIIKKRSAERKKSVLKLTKKTAEKKIKKVEVNSVSKETASVRNTEFINIDAPDYDEFLRFARTLKNYVPEADLGIKEQYDSWAENGWKNTYNNKPITDWKEVLTNNLPFLIEGKLNEEIRLPRIINPKI